MKFGKGKEAVTKRIEGQSWLAVLLGVIMLAVLLGVLEPVFLSFTNLKNILVQSSVTAIIAVGMTFVIMTNGIDISVAMNMFLIMSFMHLMQQAGLPVGIIFPAAVLLGAGVGIINGFLICILNIVPMIATFATMSICRGIAYLLIHSKMVVPDTSLRFFGLTNVGGIPLAVILMLGAVVLGTYLLEFTRFGRYVLAVGNSVTSAKESGIAVHRVRFGTYAFCGLCTGVASLIYLGRLGAIQTDAGYGMEFTVITAVVLGGTKLSGGRGTVIGGFVGCIFLTLIENGLNLLEVSGFYYDVVRGVILFIAVAIETVSDRRQKKKLAFQRAKRLKGEA